MDKYDEALDIVVSMSKVKMVMNSHKGDIERLSPEDLAARAKDEIDELLEAMKSGNYIETINEAGDVLNFLVGAVQRALMQYRDRKHDETNT